MTISSLRKISENSAIVFCSIQCLKTLRFFPTASPLAAATTVAISTLVHSKIFHQLPSDSKEGMNLKAMSCRALTKILQGMLYVGLSTQPTFILVAINVASFLYIIYNDQESSSKSKEYFDSVKSFCFKLITSCLPRKNFESSSKF